MKKIVNREEFLGNKDFFIEEIIKGKVFIYPTDTLPGIGANARNFESVERILKMKKRPGKPLLVIAPSFEWIFDKCEIANKKIKQLIISKLPGPFSFILKLKDFSSVSSLVVNNGTTIGVRLPDNWFAKIIEEAEVPFVSTSINFSGEASVKKLDEIPNEIFDSVDYVVWDEGFSGKGSVVIDVVEGLEKVLRD